MVAQLGLEKKKRFNWTKKRVRKRTNEGNAKFGEMVKDMDWDSFYQDCQDNPTGMALELHKLLTEWMDVCFPYKRSDAGLVKIRG